MPALGSQLARARDLRCVSSLYNVDLRMLRPTTMNQPQPQPISPVERPAPLPDFAEPPDRKELQLAPTPPIDLNSEAIAIPAKSFEPDSFELDFFEPDDGSTLPASSDRRTPISDAELSVPRVQMGSLFIGSSALGLVCLLLWMSAFHPEFDWQVGVHEYWYPYVGFVCLGVSGLIVLARESLRK